MECLNDTERPEGTCTAFALVHMVGMTENEVHTVKIGNKAWNENELGAMFKHKAESYAQDLPGVQSFCLLAFYGISNSPGARHPWRVTGDTEFGGLATEGPHPQGQIQQSMRHTEVIVAGSFRQNATTFEVMLRYMEQQSRMTVRLTDQNEKLFDLLRSNFVSTLEMQQKLLGIEERKQLLGMAGPLLNAVTGENLFPASVEEQSIIAEVAEELTPERLHALQMALPQKTWAKVMPRLMKILEEKKAAQQSAQEVGESILERGLTPEQEVMGEGIPRNTNGTGTTH